MGALAFARMIPTLFSQSPGLGETGLSDIFEDRAGFEKAATNLVAASEALLKVTQATTRQRCQPR